MFTRLPLDSLRRDARSPSRRVLCCALAIALGGFGQACGAPPVPSQTTAGITTITLERNCSGCPTGSVLVLHRDGRALYSLTGNARLGTADRTSTGRIAPDEFERLARLAVSTGFFALNDVYEDAQIRDGAWATTTIARDGHDKQVLRREDAGPPALDVLEAAIDTAKARIRLDP